MSDFWRILAVSAYGSALAWRSRAVDQGHTITELRPLESYNNLQKATADYRAVEAEALSVLTDSGGGGPVEWEGILNVPDEFNPKDHAYAHALDGSDPIYPLTIGARPTGVNIPFNEIDAPNGFVPSLHASTHAAGGTDVITPESINACELTGGLVPINRLPPLAITDRFTAASEAEMVALIAQPGDICYRSDQGRYYQKVNTENLITDWIAWLEPPVLSVNGLNGDVVLPPLIPAPHASSHHLGGVDAISAEAIGARPVGVAIPWAEVVNGPLIKTFKYLYSFAPFFAIPINFQNDVFAAYCCKLMGGGHIGGKGYGGFEFDFWVHRDTAPFSASLIREAYTGNATPGIILIAAASYGVDIRVVNQSTTGRQDMSLQLSIAGTGIHGFLPIF